MIDTRHDEGAISGPPWPVDLLADLHAGVIDQAEAARLWPRVQADPEAMAVISALEATTGDLARLGQTPAPPMPARVAARIDTALTAERQTPVARPARGADLVVDLVVAQQRRNRQLAWGAGLLTAAAAAATVVILALPHDTTPGKPAAQPARGTGDAPLSLRGDDLSTALGQALGERDYGPLENRQRLDQCREAAGLDPDVQPAGVRPVTLDGRPGVLVVLPTGKFATFRLVVFAPSCGPGNPGVLSDETVGGTTR